MAVADPTAVRSERGLVLTSEQRRAVEWGDGPLMVLAGAGTGKTTVVVERVGHLLRTQPSLAPENVLVLTYNVRAAAELMDRLEQLLGLEIASRLWVHNFHSLGHRILSDHRAELGLDVNADVLDAVGQRLLLRELRPRFADFVYHPMARDRNAAGRFADVISRAKDELVTPDEYRTFAQARREAFEVRYGLGEFDHAVEGLRRRDAEGTAWQVRLVRRDLVNSGPEAGRRTADREARREVAGTGEAVYWRQLSEDQQRLVRGLTPTYVRDAEAFDVLRLLEEAEAYSVYQDELRARGQLDFGEQQLRAIELLMERPNILRRYQDQFRHVLVDEFQDANMAQILLLELIARGPGKTDNVVVVGDDDQSIYRFRGASYAAFERFRERFEQAPSWAPDRPTGRVESQPLLDNRRSTGNVLSAAGRLIDRNQKRLKHESLRPTKPAGEPVRLVYAADEQDEADVVVDWVRQVRERQPAASWSDIAILYRKHRHRELIVERLRKQDVPYVVVGAAGLFNVAEVRDVESALRVAAQPEDSSAFVRLLSAGPWRLDAAEILRVTSAANWDGRPIYQAALDILREGKIAVSDVPARRATPAVAAPTLWTETDFDENEPDTVKQRRSREQRAQWRREELDVRLRLKLERLMQLLNSLVPRGQREGPFAVLEEFLTRTNLLHDLIALETPEAQRSVLALARFMRFVADWQHAHPHDSLAQFIGYLDVYEDVGGDLDSDQHGRLDIDGVRLMTVYQAKGLEFEAVAVPRLVEGQFPDTREDAPLIPLELLKQAPPDDFAIDEERRLLYVAMTRAKGQLLLSAPQNAGARSGPSRFVAEISRSVDGPAPVSSEDFEPAVPDDLEIERRAAGPQAEVDEVTRGAAASAHENSAQLLKLMPVPLAYERRFALRRRAVELLGMLESLAPDDHEGRAALTADLVATAEQAAGVDNDAAAGRDPVTLDVVSRHAPAGRALLEMAALPATFSHSQLHTYSECPLQYAFQRVYRIPVAETPGYFEFGHVIHRAFEVFTRQRRDAAAAGQAPPGYEELKRAFDEAWQPRNFADAQAAQHYASRAEPALRRFYDREVSRLAEAVDFEAGFTLELDGSPGEQPVRLYGVIDRIDRHPDGTIEITDYKTGRPRRQADVDVDEQLSAYALAMAMGAVPDPVTHEPLPAAGRLTLYFTETDQALSTTRSPEQLDAFRDTVLEKARRIRSGDFTATPDKWRCGRCDYRLICPSRFGAATA